MQNLFWGKTLLKSIAALIVHIHFSSRLVAQSVGPRRRPMENYSHINLFTAPFLNLEKYHRTNHHITRFVGGPPPAIHFVALVVFVISWTTSTTNCSAPVPTEAHLSFCSVKLNYDNEVGGWEREIGEQSNWPEVYN